ncbi:MAG: PEP-CTERM sorting domain-containing protein [Planctomycetes bacterium]|nr:PEP-CTERM sorting domain-containing protein [Planctomycetota bacterium]
MKTKFGAVCVLLAAFALPAQADVLFASDMSSSTGWGSVATSADDIATFGYDYSAMGIPMPPGGSDTIGLYLAANTVDVARGSITVFSDMVFSGVHQLEFDAWGNYSTLGGSSEFFGGGVAHDQATLNFPGVTTGSGSWLGMTTDGFSSRDYRMYKDASEQWVASTQYDVSTNNNTAPEFPPLFPAVDISTFDPPQTGQIGSTSPGAAGFQWVHVTMTVFPGLGYVQMDLATQHGSLTLGVNGRAGTAAPTSGAISFFHADLYSSVATWGFSIIDNVVVTDVPEPAGLALLAVGVLAALRRR